MGDCPLLRTWNVELIQPWRDDVAVVLSSDAKDTRNVDIVPKKQSQISSPNRFSRKIWLACSEKSAWSDYTAFDISLPWYHLSDWCASSAVWSSASGYSPGASVNLPPFFQCWHVRPNRIMHNSSSNWTERCWFSFNPAKVCSREWNCMHGLHRLYWQPTAISHNDM